MQKKRILILSCFSVLLLAALFLLNPKSTFQHVDNQVYQNDKKQLGNFYFSEKSGFYDSDFQLQIVAPYSEIYYTLDGTEPDQNSLVYTDGIHITDATPNENVHSVRKDTTTGFYSDLIAEYCDNRNPGYTVPTEPVDKCTIVKAVCYDTMGKKSETITATYFVDSTEKASVQGVGVISITTDPANLFDYETGIMVTGKVFDDFCENGMLNPEVNIMAPYWQWWDANYRQNGKDWERPAVVQVFDADHALKLTQEVGLRVQGGGSRGYLVKSFSLYSRKSYAQNTAIHFDFWGTKFNPDKMTLFSGGDDYYTITRDRMMADLTQSEGLNYATMHFSPYAVFLDGEYWGLYYANEKYDSDYFRYYYHFGTDNAIVIKNGLLEEGEDEDFLLFEQMRTFMRNADLSDPENYAHACKIVDMDSLIDYFAAELYVARYNDWMGFDESNALWWRSRKIGTEDCEDGRWRMGMFDMNSGCLSYNLIDYDSIANLTAYSQIFLNLNQNPVFRQTLVDKIIELGKGLLSYENVHILLERYEDEVGNAITASLLRNYGAEKANYHENLQSIDAFFSQRYENMLNILKTSYPDCRIDG